MLKPSSMWNLKSLQTDSTVVEKIAMGALSEIEKITGSDANNREKVRLTSIVLAQASRYLLVVHKHASEMHKELKNA